MATIADPSLKPPPPDPGPALTKSRAAAEADAMRSKAQLQADMAVLFANHEADAKIRSAKLIADLQAQATIQANHAAAANPRSATPEPPPPPLLPTVNVNPSKPMSGAQTPADMASHFGSVVAGAGADPSLAAGGGGARQVLEAAKGGQQGGPLGDVPMIDLPGMQPPPPSGVPQTGNPSVTLDNGQTFSAPAFVPTNTVQNKSGSVVEGGQRMPINESTVTSEMRPNVLTPGDILQANQNQQMLQWRKNVDRVTLSMDLYEKRAHVQHEAAQLRIEGNKAAAFVVAERARAAGATAEAMLANSKALTEDQTRRFAQEDQAYLRGIRGDVTGQYSTGGSSAPGMAGGAPGTLPKPIPGALTRTSFPFGSLAGAKPLSSLTSIDPVSGKIVVNPQAESTYLTKTVLPMVNQVFVRPKDEQAQPGGVATRLTSAAEAALAINMLPVQVSGAQQGGLFTLYSTTPGEGAQLQHFADVLQVLALATHNPNDTNDPFYGTTFNKTQLAAAQKQVIDWGIAKPGKPGDPVEQVTTGDWAGVSRMAFQGLHSGKITKVIETDYLETANRNGLSPEMMHIRSLKTAGPPVAGGVGGFSMAPPSDMTQESPEPGPAAPPADLYLDSDLRWAREHLPRDHPARLQLESQRAAREAARGPTVLEELGGRISEDLRKAVPPKPYAPQYTKPPTQAERILAASRAWVTKQPTQGR